MSRLRDLDLEQLDEEWEDVCPQNQHPFKFGGMAELHLLRSKKAKSESPRILKTPLQHIWRAIQGDDSAHSAFKVSWRKEELVPEILNGCEGIVKVYETGYGPRPFLVMEFEELGDVRRLRGKIGLYLWADFARQLLSILQQTHAKGVWHLDLKPHNLFYTHDGRVLISDWGIAKIYPAITQSFESSLTIGTPEYMAPEQCQGRSKASPSSDIFSAGILLTELLTGTHPISTRGPAAIIDINSSHPVEIPSVGSSSEKEVSRLALSLMTIKSIHARAVSPVLFASMYESIVFGTIPAGIGRLNCEVVINHFTRLGNAANSEEIGEDSLHLFSLFGLAELIVLRSASTNYRVKGFEGLSDQLNVWQLRRKSDAGEYRVDPAVSWLIERILSGESKKPPDPPMVLKTIPEICTGWYGQGKVRITTSVEFGTAIASAAGQFGSESNWDLEPYDVERVDAVWLTMFVSLKNPDKRGYTFAAYLVFENAAGGETFIGFSPHYEKEGFPKKGKGNEWGVPLIVEDEKWELYRLNVQSHLGNAEFDPDRKPVKLKGIRLRGNWQLKSVRVYEH